MPGINSDICVAASFLASSSRGLALPLRTFLPSSSLRKERKMDDPPHRPLKMPIEPIKIQQRKQQVLPRNRDAYITPSASALCVPSRYTSSAQPAQVVSEHSTAGSPLSSSERRLLRPILLRDCDNLHVGVWVRNTAIDNSHLALWVWERQFCDVRRKTRGKPTSIFNHIIYIGTQDLLS